jgi:Holliday junction resolvasome RuvABC DNA-binding subunit
MRRAVLRRDRQCCVVPGCRNSRFLDIHHLRSRAEGGDNDANNLITLCGAHHRAAHRGELEIAGSVSTGVRFRHADGNGYGQAVDSCAVETRGKVFAALRRLGFRETETRHVLAQIGAKREPNEANFESILREALAGLTTGPG